METYGLEKLGIINASAVYRNLTPAQLTEHALRRGEGTLSNTARWWSRPASIRVAVPTINSLWTPPPSMTRSHGAR